MIYQTQAAAEAAARTADAALVESLDVFAFEPGPVTIGSLNVLRVPGVGYALSTDKDRRAYAGGAVYKDCDVVAVVTLDTPVSGGR